jgi:nitroreductase
MIKKVKKIFPSLAPILHIIMGYLFDIYKFSKSSSNFVTNKRISQLESVLLRQYHGIEKGLSLNKPRMGFGQPLVETFILNIRFYYSSFGYNNLVKICCDVLLEYRIYHNDYHKKKILHHCKKIDEILIFIIEYDKNEKRTGGVKKVLKKELLATIENFDFKKFSESRYSIRNFDKNISVPIELIRKAILIASKSPSACNRQAWKVYVFKDEKKDLVLNHQNGNRGFRDSIDTVLLITGLTSSFAYSERHGAWVDGGIFSMSLLYALHSFGLGTCSLNTGYTLKQELGLRKAINLSLNEEPIMMIAVGGIKDVFNIANSSRKSVDDLMVLVK